MAEKYPVLVKRLPQNLLDVCVFPKRNKKKLLLLSSDVSITCDIVIVNSNL